MGLRLVVPWGRPRAPLLPALGEPSPFYWRRQALLTPTGRASRRRPLRRRIARHRRRQPGPRLCPSTGPRRRPLPRSLPRCFLGPRLGSATGERLRACGITDGDPFCASRHCRAPSAPRRGACRGGWPAGISRLTPATEGVRDCARQSRGAARRTPEKPSLDGTESPVSGFRAIPQRPQAQGGNGRRPLRRKIARRPGAPAGLRPLPPPRSLPRGSADSGSAPPPTGDSAPCRNPRRPFLRVETPRPAPRRDDEPGETGKDSQRICRETAPATEAGRDCAW